MFFSSINNNKREIMIFRSIPIIFLCLLSISFTQSNRIPKSKAWFDGYKVLNIQIPNEEARSYIVNPGHHALYDIWAEPRINYTSDIMVAPEKLEEVTHGLTSNGLEFSITIEDVQKLIELESTPVTRNKDINPKHPMTWTEYHDQEDMEAYMDYLAETYPDLVSIDNIGLSYEQRPMRVLKICKGGICGQKPAMWIDGGIHAREWITPAVTTFHIKELVENSGNYPSDILDKLDWYILPVHNPDGYAYTRKSNATRCWRKNRAPNSCAEEETSARGIGTDLNRNYPYKWNQGGSSSDPCSDTYMGPSAGSEPEVQNVMKYVSKIKKNIKFHQSLHAFGQLIMFPWGYTNDRISDYDELFELGTKGNEALYEKHGKPYSVGSIPETIGYKASGNSADYAKGELDIPYVYTIELRPKDSFLLPAAEIIPCAEEIVAFHVVAAQQIIKEFST